MSLIVFKRTDGKPSKKYRATLFYWEKPRKSGADYDPADYHFALEMPSGIHKGAVVSLEELIRYNLKKKRGYIVLFSFEGKKKRGKFTQSFNSREFAFSVVLRKK